MLTGNLPRVPIAHPPPLDVLKPLLPLGLEMVYTSLWARSAIAGAPPS
ncbi:MAG: hypothetical protein V3T92_03325 [Anaerolineae bacterium]